MEDTPGLVIGDPGGSIIWGRAGAKSYADFRIQSYRGQPVLTWWESSSTGLAAYGNGRDVVVTDLDHNPVTSIERHAGASPDEHEFLITPPGTALITSYVKVPMNLSRYGGSAKGSVLNGIFEEIDLSSGRVLLHWESLDRVGLSESHAGLPQKAADPYDYFHINAVKRAPDGDILVSARHTWAMYKINRMTGRMQWRLGGKRSDFDPSGRSDLRLAARRPVRDRIT